MSLLRPALIVGLATAASRLLGFARDVAVAGLLGAGPVADAFLAAVRLPNALRRSLGEGALNAGFVPIYARLRRQHGSAQAASFAGHAIVAAGLGLTVLTALAMLAASALMLALAPGFAGDPARLAPARTYLMLMLPFVGLASLASLVGAWLNAEQRFLAAAAAPATVNALLLAAYTAIPRWVTGDAAVAGAMAAALALAGALQLGVVLAAARRLPHAFRLLRPPPWRGLARLLVLGAPGLVASASAQMLVLVAAGVASAEAGAVSWLYYADRLFQLPLSFAGVAAGTVLLADMAGAAGPAVRRGGDGRDPLNAPLEAALALALPAAVALAVLAEPIVRILFQRGAFAAGDTAGTAAALAGLAAGLPCGVVTKVLLQPFFARELAVLPLVTGLAALAVTWLAALFLAGPLGVAGLAAAVTAGLAVQAVLLGGILAARHWWRPDGVLAGRFAGLLAASAVMGLVVAALARWGAPALAAESLLLRAAALAGLCLTGLAVYAVAALAFGGIDRRVLARRRAA
ncbi:murein biosynthesis integral membrane protein MurJ [Chelatococcus reniformis]|uniref:Probable lipid II flippase MurJ n=1 Tax=Chelatococcus reniformis TaxID=1494448 RepID=A0A916TYG9_9HYPH|nr:murein biosynthesis integral membrane protein MurJ [Chelatococcus reniformis]GGC52012.1 putative lipid II flippase MurJ [Chelatococcus reniformis]